MIKMSECPSETTTIRYGDLEEGSAFIYEDDRDAVLENIKVKTDGKEPHTKYTYFIYLATGNMYSIEADYLVKPVVVTIESIKLQGE